MSKTYTLKDRHTQIDTKKLMMRILSETTNLDEQVELMVGEDNIVPRDERERKTCFDRCEYTLTAREALETLVSFLDDCELLKTISYVTFD